MIAKAPKSMHTFDLVSQKRVYSLRPACHSWRQSSCCGGRRTRSGYWDLRPPAAAGGRPGSMCRLLEACCSTLQPLRHRRPCVPCRRRLSTLLQASPTEKDVAGTLFDSRRRSSTGVPAYLERSARSARSQKAKVTSPCTPRETICMDMVPQHIFWPISGSFWGLRTRHQHRVLGLF